jgi:hypothetical protein
LTDIQSAAQSFGQEISKDCDTGRPSSATVLHFGFEIAYAVKAVVSSDMDRTMQDVSKQTPNAERLTKRREGFATRLKRIGVAFEDLRDAIERVLAERQRNDPQQDARQ